MKRLQQVIVVAVLLSLALDVNAAKAKPFIIAPSKGTGPFPVALWLHGYRGYNADGYFAGATAAAMQKHADAIGAVIVGFPATIDLADNTQQWAEDPVVDHAYIQSRLKEIGTNVNMDLSRVALFGFSQGAVVAADLATLYPTNYLGAILMSPGGLGKPNAAKVRKPEHGKQVYFCLCGADEAAGNVALTKAYAAHLEKVLGANVTLKLYPGVWQHTRPPDFVEKFPEWMNAILKDGAGR